MSIQITAANTNEQPFSTEHHSETGFSNTDPRVKQDMSKLGSILKRYMFEKRVDPVPEHIPLEHIVLSDLQGNSELLVYRLGHSSMLLKLEQKIWLTDPVFSERASPVQWFGPKRFHPVPMNIEQLDTIEGVIISHDHYDHLDEATIKAIHHKVKYFVVPLGVDKHLLAWGVEANKIYATDWWQQHTFEEVTITATPTQHFSGRGLFDGNETLWASWVIETEQHKLFFSGDSGYFDGFKQIGERFGPFDLTMMETGAYDKDWADIHMTPEESVQAHIDLQGKLLLPIHNGTFDLALHPWYDPFERLHSAALKHKVQIVTPIVGEQVSLTKSRTNVAWWQGLTTTQTN